LKITRDRLQEVLAENEIGYESPVDGNLVHGNLPLDSQQQPSADTELHEANQSLQVEVEMLRMKNEELYQLKQDFETKVRKCTKYKQYKYLLNSICAVVRLFA